MKRKILFVIHLALVEKTGPYPEQIPSDVCVHDLRAAHAGYGIFALLRLVWRLRPDVLFSHLGSLSLAVVVMLRPFLPSGTRVLLQRIEGTLRVPDGDLAGLASSIERTLAPNARGCPALPAQYRLEQVLRAYARVLSEGETSARDAAIG